MPDLWFFLGLATGMIITGFCAVGAFDRGVASVQRGAWSTELTARKRAVVAARTSLSKPAVASVARTSLSQPAVASAAISRAG